MRRIWRYIGVAVIVVAVMAVGGFWYWGQQNLARPTVEALTALESDAVVSVSRTDWFVFSPASGAPPRRGVVVYPGANCDPRGYAPILRELAARGYLAVAVPMPFNLAILAPERASAVRAGFPDVEEWVIIGHSMGGAMAGYYADHHAATLAGIIFWDAYPPQSNDLSGTDLPAWHIHRARPDGSPPEKFQAMADLFPPGSTWVPVPGGIHMYFGSFDGGGYVEQWEPQISRAEQLRIVTQATLTALEAIFATASRQAGGVDGGAEERT